MRQEKNEEIAKIAGIHPDKSKSGLARESGIAKGWRLKKRLLTTGSTASWDR